MQIEVQYQGLENSQWMDRYISRQVSKLNRYLGPSSTVHVNVKKENDKYFTLLSIHGLTHNYFFSSDGLDMYESFSLALDKALRELGEHKRKVKEKMNRKFFKVKAS